MTNFEAGTLNLRLPVFLSVGECMIEMAPDGMGRYKKGFAGDTFNTAWYSRALLPEDWRVSYMTTVGQDKSSSGMLSFFSDEGINVDHVNRIAGKTVGLYLIDTKDGERSFTYWRRDSAARHLADSKDRLNKAFASAGLVYFSGITLAILTEESRAQLLDALKVARGQGAVIAFDPNIRPALFPVAAQMCEIITAGASMADIVLPSFDDESAAFGDVEPAATAVRYHASGAKLVIVKNAAGDVLISQGGKCTSVAVPQAAEIVDTTSAGDAFNAAFLSSLALGNSAVNSAACAVQVAGKVIAGPGALVRGIEAIANRVGVNNP